MHGKRWKQHVVMVHKAAPLSRSNFSFVYAFVVADHLPPTLLQTPRIPSTRQVVKTK